MDQVVSLHHAQCERHPRNMRLRYPLREVRRMALSQAERARQGLEPCVHALVVTPAPTPGRYIIVAGHLRHAGNVYLKDKAPLLNCIVRHYAGEAEMLADMAAENGIRAEISPLGWARHFGTQRDAGKAVKQMARESGRSVPQVRLYLSLLDLSAAAQDLIDRGDLPVMAARHLIVIDDRRAQATAAREFAEHKATLRQIALGVQALRAQQVTSTTPDGNGHTKGVNGVNGHALEAAPAQVPALAAPRLIIQPETPAIHRLPASLDDDMEPTLADIRTTSRQVCAECEIGKGLPLKEPAWHIALVAAGQTCRCCNVRTLNGACKSCPLPDMLKRVVQATKQS